MIEFNLVPENLRNRSRTAVNWLRVGAVLAVALTLLMVSGSIINRMNLAIYQQELVAQRPSVENVENLERNLRDLRRENQAISSELSGLRSLADESETKQFLGFLNQLAAATPEAILLEAIEYNRPGSVWVAGISADPEEIAGFLDRIQMLPGVEEVALAQLRRPAGEESPLRRFEVRIAWRAGEA